MDATATLDLTTIRRASIFVVAIGRSARNTRATFAKVAIGTEIAIFTSRAVGVDHCALACHTTIRSAGIFVITVAIDFAKCAAA